MRVASGSEWRNEVPTNSKDAESRASGKAGRMALMRRTGVLQGLSPASLLSCGLNRGLPPAA